jgi:hypothetical protein
MFSDEVRAGMARLTGVARSRGVSIAIHTHVNAAQSVTPLVARAAAAMLEAGVRDVRNQGVLLSIPTTTRSIRCPSRARPGGGPSARDRAGRAEVVSIANG